jgi:hypothetical protein
LMMTNLVTLSKLMTTGSVVDMTSIDALAYGIELTWNEPTLCSPVWYEFEFQPIISPAYFSLTLFSF